MLVDSLCLLFGFDVLVVCLVGVCCLVGIVILVLLCFCFSVQICLWAGRLVDRLLLSAFLLLLGVLFVVRCSLSFG